MGQDYKAQHRPSAAVHRSLLSILWTKCAPELATEASMEPGFGCAAKKFFVRRLHARKLGPASRQGCGAALHQRLGGILLQSFAFASSLHSRGVMPGRLVRCSLRRASEPTEATEAGNLLFCALHHFACSRRHMLLMRLRDVCLRVQLSAHHGRISVRTVSLSSIAAPGMPLDHSIRQCS